MTKKRSIFIGQKIRRLRLDLGLTQSEMAEDLDISASYIALIENNQRPVTAAILLKFADIYRLDIASLARGTEDDFAAQLAGALGDPLFADLGLSPIDIQDFGNTFPAAAEAVMRLYTAYKESQIMLADKTGGQNAGSDPVAEVRRFLEARKNCFPDIDDRGEALARDIKRAGGLESFFADRRIRVRKLPADIMMGYTRRYDPHRAEVTIDEALDAASSAFQLALQLVYLDMPDLLEDLMAKASFDTDSGKKLARRALANYAAGAIMMPYRSFLKAAETRAYDVEALGRHFGASFEQVAHRLTTLQKPGQEGVPFFFIRIDGAGNVSKRLDGAGFPFARHGGSCPLWGVHKAFTRPRQILTQWVELPEGERFFTIMRTVTAGGGAYKRPTVERAVALCCSAQHAQKLIYARDIDPSAIDPTPIGVSCRLCHRSDCMSRAEPPTGRPLTSDDYRRPTTPFGLDSP